MESHDVLKIAVPTKVIQLDPHKYEDLYSMMVISQIYSRLFRYTPDGQIRMDAVADWSVSNDKTKYTFKLKAIKFSDGSPITAYHVERSLKRAFLMKAAISSDLSIIEGAAEYARTRSLDKIQIHALNDTTLEIKTTRPTSLLLYLLAVPDCSILKLSRPEEELVTDFARGAFSGVFRISGQSKDELVLAKWRSGDFDSLRPPQTVLIRKLEQMPPQSSELGALTDTSSYLTFDQSQSPFEGLSGWRPVISEASNERFLVLNPKTLPANVRHWLARQIDTTELVKEIGDPSIIPAFGLIPSCLAGHLTVPIKDAMRTELKLSKPISITVIHGENLPYREQFYAYLKRVWRHPQIHLEFQSLPVQSYLKKLFGKKGQVIIGAKGLDYPEGFSVLGYFRGGIDSNYFHIKSRAVDQLLDKAAVELDPVKRAGLYREIQTEVLKEDTVVPLAFGSFKKYYWSNRVSKVPPHPIGAQFIPFEMLEMADK